MTMTKQRTYRNIQGVCALLLSFVLVMSMVPTIAFAQAGGQITNGSWAMTDSGAFTVKPNDPIADPDTATISSMPWADEVPAFNNKVVTMKFETNSSKARIVLDQNAATIFQNKPYLKRVDLSALDNSQLTNMENMFAGSDAIETIVIGENFKLARTIGESVIVCHLPPGNWYSSKAEMTFTAEGISNSRADIADTYVRNDKEPTIIEGADSTWELTEETELMFTSSAHYKDYRDVFVDVDGSSVPQNGGTVFSYTKSESGTIVIGLTPAYLKQLGVGDHKIGIKSMNGTAWANFKIVDKNAKPDDPEDPENPDDPKDPENPDDPKDPNDPNTPNPDDDTQPTGTQTIYRLYNPNSGEHLFTTSIKEVETNVPLGWKNEGIAWKSPVLSSSPVYRFYNPNSGDHHYSISQIEMEVLIRIGWRYEGIGWYSDDKKTKPIYRLFNPNEIIGTHHYTTSAVEYDRLGLIGWKREQIGWYGL